VVVERSQTKKLMACFRQTACQALELPAALAFSSLPLRSDHSSIRSYDPSPDQTQDHNADQSFIPR